nr:GH116 family glycosyl hydrolase [Saccharolobus caldissimus]
MDFFNDLTIGNLTIMNNWSNPLKLVRGFHIVELTTGTFLQGNPLKGSEVKYNVKTAKIIEADAFFPQVMYKTKDPDFTIRIYSPFVPHNLKDSSLPVIIFNFKGNGVIAISFPNITGSRRWGRVNFKVKGKVNGVLMKNLRALQSDPAYGEIFLGCEGCKTHVGHSLWVPAIKEGMTEDISVFNKLNENLEKYYIKPFAREEISGIVWKEIKGEEYFYLTWYFNGRPHNYPYGHYYENWFKSAVDVAEYVNENKPGIELDEDRDWLNEAFRNSLYVITNSWLTKDGRFAIYEDPQISLLMNTIGGMTWDGASFALLEFFPELVKKMDEYFTIYINEGEVPHDLGEESIEDPIYGASYPYSWNDLGSTWILMIFRDYKFTNDLDFLKRNYPYMKKVIDWLIRKDEDGDGIPDSKGGFDNSYDGTYMYGASSYVGSLFLCSLKAFITASKILGYDTSEYEKILDKAKETMNSLWNGRYFIAWKSGELKKESCMNSQILGEFWCDILGLGNVIDEEKVISALKSIYELNGKASKFCLVNSVNPDGSIDESTDQMKSCWPRISFAIASHMILKGMVNEGLEIARKEWDTISSRYPWNQPSKINAFNGDHFGLPYYIGSLSVYLVKYALKVRQFHP